MRKLLLPVVDVIVAQSSVTDCPSVVIEKYLCTAGKNGLVRGTSTSWRIMNTTDESEYERRLQAARSADLSAVEDKKIVQVVWDDDDTPVQDKDGNVVMVIIPTLIDRTDEQWEQSFLLFVRESDEIRAHPYRLVFVMSNFQSEVWFAWWIRQMRNRLSRQHRCNLKALTIVHPSLWIRAICAGASLIYGSVFWNSLHYVDRVEELWLDGVFDEDKARQVIPSSVLSFEDVLIQEGEEMREVARVHGAPLAPRDT